MSINDSKKKLLEVLNILTVTLQDELDRAPESERVRQLVGRIKDTLDLINRIEKGQPL
jgi:hypothetical protein